MSDLRDRRHEETRAAVLVAATGLIRERGFADVTMGEIAAAAGLSRRTLYRRFATKEDIVLAIVADWVDVWDAVAARHPDGQPLAVVEACCRAVAEHIDDHRDDVLMVYEALEASPVLAASAADNEQWLERLVALLRTGSADLARADAEVVAGAYMGGIDTVMRQWAAVRGVEPLADRIDGMLTLLRPIWPRSTGSEASSGAALRGTRPRRG